ncbi:MAG: hypothetical protein NT040_11295 [Bacteroidetes bacterium]|nr:hypothetical protein [Bacteroidota bacterium]
MRKITLTHIEDPEGNSPFKERNCFRISLGNGVIAGWSNDQYAAKYMVKINLELNYKLVTLNQILIETITHYRKVWFYITNHPNHAAIEREIKSAFASIDHSLEFATTRGHYENGNHMVFRQLFCALDSLEDILTSLQKVEKYCKHYVEVRMLQVFRDRVEYVRLDLRDLGDGEGNVEMRSTPLKEHSPEKS